MSRSVWKFSLGRNPTTFEVKMPKGARVLNVDTQGSEVMLWALVDPDAEQTRRTFVVQATGEVIPHALAMRLDYVGTGIVQRHGAGDLVWHVFEVMFRGSDALAPRGALIEADAFDGPVPGAGS